MEDAEKPIDERIKTDNMLKQKVVIKMDKHTPEQRYKNMQAVRRIWR